MTDLVKRKLKTKDVVEAEVPAAPSTAPRKVRRVRRVGGGQPDASGIPKAPPEAVPEPPRPEPEEPPAPPKRFPCAKCGIDLEPGTPECPICGEIYAKSSSSPQGELGQTMMPESGTAEEMLDADDGIVSYLENAARPFEVALICSECGTAVEFATDKCPICGADMENPDAGLVGLISEMSFEEVEPGDVVCPQCGEIVRLTKGKCPECKSIVLKPDPHGILRRLDPVVHGDNIVFLHLDVESGELNYLQKAVRKDGFEKLTVKLEGQ